MINLTSIALFTGYSLLITWLLNRNPDQELPRTLREEMYRI